MGNQPGKYQHQNQSGRPKKNVTWKSAEPPSPPGRPVLIPLSDQQPDVVNLRWERPKLDGGSPITGYVVEHRRMGSPHWVRATPTPVPGCEVSISGLEPGWRYQFRAFAENVVGRSEASELSDALTVTLQRNAISVPRFVDELQDTQAVENERIEFRVRILGQPQPEVSWFKDGYEIFSSRRTKIVNDNDASILIIHQVALTDEGEIRCTATNRAGHVVTRAQLRVEAPPKIRLPRTYEDGLIVEADEVLRLKVGIAGQPTPTVVWLHEGEPVRAGGRFEIATTDKNSLLKIDNIQRADRGEYSIRASNRLGEDVTSFLVTVTARPNPPGRVRLNMSFGKSATLSWTAPVDDGGCKIGNYIVEYFRVGWNVWLKAATTRSLSTTLNDLIEGSEYKFRVKAENPYGLSDPSEESEVLFIPDPKRGITKPKSETRIAEPDPSKPVPPRRKTLSPPRPSQQDAATETVSKRTTSPNVARKTWPQVLDDDALHREMSYGTPDQVLKKDIRKSPSQSSADSTPQTQSKAKTLPQTQLQKQTQGPKLGLNVEAAAMPARSPPRSPTMGGAAGTPLTPTKTEVSLFGRSTVPKPRMATPERSATPEVRNRSRSPLTAPAAPAPLRKSPTPPEPIKFTPALQRSTEPVQLGVNQHVRRFSGHALSPVRDAPKLAIAIALGGLGASVLGEGGRGGGGATESEGVEEVGKTNDSGNGSRAGNGNANRNESGNRNGSRIGNGNRDESGNRNGNGIVNSNESGYRSGNGGRNGGGNGKQNAGTITNPTIQISSPPLVDAHTPPTPTPTATPISPLSIADKHDDVHTSNEFMLVVFDKNSKVKDKGKQDSFELDLEDALQPPPISISSPDLASLEFTNLHSFPLRRSVSSTELLYERAMARFYEAVELEEAEKARKLKTSQERSMTPATSAAAANVPPMTVRKRLGSMTEAERLSFERRSELRRQSADIVQDIGRGPTKWGSRENIASLKPLSRTTGALAEHKRRLSHETDDLSELQTRSAPNKTDSYDLGSDYTESTASSDDDDSIEKFKMELMARTRSPSPKELETYHPRNMSAGVFTPYRSPEPQESALVLNRPMPLASPDFVPKPILKRPSNENMVKEEQTPPSPLPASSATNDSKSMDLAKGLKSFFKRDKKTATEKNTEVNEQLSGAAREKETAAAVEVESKRRVKEEEERKRQEAERIMQEESKVAVDHYSDLVRQVSSTRKYHTPLYLDRDELKKAAERATREGLDEEESSLMMRRSQSPDIAGLAPPPLNLKPRLSISERGQLKHVRDTASDLALVQSRAAQRPDTPSEESSPPASELQQSPPAAQSPTPTPASAPPHMTTTSTVVSETYVERPDSRGRTRLVKVKRIVRKRVPSSTRSRDTSVSRPPSSVASTQDIVVPVEATQPAVRRRVASRTRSAVRGESKSPGPLSRNRSRVLPGQEGDPESGSLYPQLALSLSNGQLLELKSAEQMTEEAQEKVRSALSYSTDLVLFMVACYVYLFKDARLVLPILALMIYRQLGEAISAHIPNWMRRKKD